MSSNPLATVNPVVFNFINGLKANELRSEGLSFRSSTGNDSSRKLIESLSTGLAEQKLLLPFITSMITLLAKTNKPFLTALGDYIKKLLAKQSKPKPVDAFVIPEKILRPADILKMLGDEPKSYQIDDGHDSDEAHGGNTTYHDQFVYKYGEAEFLFTMSYKIASHDSIKNISLRTTTQGADVSAYSGWVNSHALTKELTELWRENNQ